MASDVCFYNFNISVLTQSHHILIGLKGKTAIFVGNEVEALFSCFRVNRNKYF